MIDLRRTFEDWARISAFVVFVIFAGLAVVLLLGLLTTPNATFGGLTAVLVAGAALLFNAWQFGQKADNDRSRFALDMAMDGVRRAHGILAAAEPAARLEWINAGRILARAIRMSKDIRAEDHKTAWELFREEWRIKFYYFTRRSPEYYFGLPEPADYQAQRAKQYGDEKIIGLLKASVVETEFGMTRAHSSGTSSTVLSETAIKVIYDFAEFDETWNDPLDAVESFTDAQIERIRRRDTEGLYVFLYARRKWLVIGHTVKEWAQWKREQDEEDESEMEDATESNGSAG